MAILVTGASGTIGSALVKFLAERDADVIAMSRHQPEIQGTFVSGDFSRFEDLRQLDGYPLSAVVHLAAVTGGCSEEDGLAVNVEGTRRLIRYGLDRGCRKFILASSIAATGCLDNAFVPRTLPIPDEHPCDAVDMYGTSKFLMEGLARYFHRGCEDADFLCFRIGAVQEGVEPVPCMDHPPYLPFTMLGFVMLADVVGALAAGLDAHTPGVRIMNLAGPEAAVTEPTADVLARVLNQSDADLDLSYFRQPGNEHATVFDITRIQQDLGYTFQDTPRDHLSKE